MREEKKNAYLMSYSITHVQMILLINILFVYIHLILSYFSISKTIFQGTYKN